MELKFLGHQMLVAVVTRATKIYRRCNYPSLEGEIVKAMVPDYQGRLIQGITGKQQMD
jgi:hypothetical protein